MTPVSKTRTARKYTRATISRLKADDGCRSVKVRYQVGKFALRKRALAEHLNALVSNKWPIEVIGNIYENAELLEGDR
jgi:YopX protein